MSVKESVLSKNNWLRQKARGQQCTMMLEGVCNHDNTTTVGAHVYLPGHGKMGGKTSDLHIAWLCSACHDVLDGRVKSNHDRDFVRARAYEAVLRTQLRLLEVLSADERRKLGEAL